MHKTSGVSLVVAAKQLKQSARSCAELCKGLVTPYRIAANVSVGSESEFTAVYLL